MAAGSVTMYSNALLGMTKASFNLATDTLVCVLLTSSYTPAPNTDTTWTTILANEVATGGGYTAGGIALTSLSDTLTTATVTWTAGTVTWSAATITAKYAVIVRRAGGALAGTDLLLSYVDLNSSGGSVSSTASTFVVSWPSGILTFTHTP